MTHRISYWEKAGIAFLLLLPFFASCAHEEELGEGKGIVHISGKVMTRTSVYEGEDYPAKELISDWWMIVVNSSNSIVESVQHTTGTPPLSEEEFTLALVAGPYTFYYFANITQAKVESLAGLSTGDLDKGNTLTVDLSAVTYNITSDADLSFANGTKKADLADPIPMSGKWEQTLTKDQQVELEFIRMLAKMEFTFKNASKKKITLNNLTLKPLHEGNILLLPNYTTLTYNDEKDPVILGSGVTEKTVGTTVNFPTATELTANSYETESETMTFYLRESVAKNHPTGHFMMNMNIDRDDVSEPLLFTLSDEAFTGINRNDFWKIPIKFTDYVVKLNVDFYPPIGGYPAVIHENKPDEFYCEFSTEGPFAIIPTVYDDYNSTYLTYPTEYEYVMETPIKGDLGIFTTVPYMDPVSGEIVGTLNNTHGTAYIKVKVTVPLGSGVSQVYERRIYIIR